MARELPRSLRAWAAGEEPGAVSTSVHLRVQEAPLKAGHSSTLGDAAGAGQTFSIFSPWSRSGTFPEASGRLPIDLIGQSGSHGTSAPIASREQPTGKSWHSWTPTFSSLSQADTCLQGALERLGRKPRSPASVASSQGGDGGAPGRASPPPLGRRTGIPGKQGAPGQLRAMRV